ncbi:MAG: helix-turn-helix domain-containing protein [Verrucomicrobia bacterium]|nr:helix-turn-helix domain-containing protein [Verrucomicrobiota bacterium]MDA7516494.1 helix-turn-helix domain-containing protein [bacterium]
MHNLISACGNKASDKNDTSTISPQWLRVEQVQALYGLSRSKVFELIREGQVVAASLSSPGKSRGVRLISRESLDELISASITTSNKEGRE